MLLFARCTNNENFIWPYWEKFSQCAITIYFVFVSQEMEEMKIELNRARTHSARLREEVRIMRANLEKEQQNHKKTSKELDELRSLNETLMEKGKEDKQNMESSLQKLETTIKQLEKENLAERGEKEVFIEETTRLRELCDQMDEAKSQMEKKLCVLREILDKTTEENKDITRKLSDYKNNILNETLLHDPVHLLSRQGEYDKIPKTSTHLSLTENAELEINTKFVNNNTGLSVELLDETRKDLARVTKEHEESKNRCEELEKQLEETLASLQRQRTSSFHDRATSPGEPQQFEFEGEFKSRKKVI